ncbi:MAG: MFS transporter [Sneathiellaceae bacterium]
MRDLLGSRWAFLILLLVGRMAMGFQLQAVGSVTPFLIDEFQVDYAQIGTLVGLYLLPGIVLALPGGFIGQALGDHRTLLVGLAAMAGGCALVANAGDFDTAMAGRLVNGAGGVLVTVMGTKMVADRFSGRILILAVALFGNGFAVGVATGQVTQVAMADAFGWRMVFWVAAAIAALGFLCAAAYRSPGGSRATGRLRFSFGLNRQQAMAVTMAGICITLHFGGFVIMVAMAPVYLAGKGLAPELASALVGINTWVAMVGMPLGGLLAQRVPPHLLVMIGIPLQGLALAALPLGLVGYDPLAVGALFAVVGICGALPAATLMSLAPTAVPPTLLGVGMGLYWSWFYTGAALLPPVAGWAADVTGDLGMPLLVAAAMSAGVLAGFVCFGRIRRRMPDFPAAA